VCDETALDQYIGNEPFVLLIDELNSLAAPLDGEASSVLRRLFQDKENRYLVFTTHVPMDTEPTPRRGCLTVPFSPCLDLGALRAMSPQCESLTYAEVMLYGGIPSLIYSVKALGEMTPEVRFARKFNRGSFHDRPELLMRFVMSVVDGCHRSEIAVFDEFSIGLKEAKIRWPLCYIACIMETFVDSEVTRAVRDNCAALSTYSSTTESGKEWECVLNIGIMVNCLYKSYGFGGAPFSIISSCARPSVLYFTIPPEYTTSADILAFINSILSSSDCFPLLMVLVPCYSKFPDFDGFIVYSERSSERAVVYGYQANTARTYPRHDMPEWIDKGYLVRGDSPAMASIRRGWMYMSRVEVQSLLGFSLGPMYPAEWPAYPTSDDFD
jgi:hypothetical protein